MNVPGYGKVWHLGHAAIDKLLDGDVTVEEKVDGSQFAFLRNLNGTLYCRLRRRQIDMDAPDDLFRLAVERAEDLNLTPGWCYYCEYLLSPMHNALAYDRVPRNNLMVFDIDTGGQRLLAPDKRNLECDRIGLEYAPTLWMGRGDELTVDDLRQWLDTESFLGGPKIEGVVIKNRTKWAEDGKFLKGKFVSEEFKEKHTAKSGETKPAFILDAIRQEYRTEARWQKAIQHLAEAGMLFNEPKDIGPMIKLVQEDVLEECADEIMERLFRWAWPQISRHLTRGLPEWYKQRLAERQFNGDVETG